MNPAEWNALDHGSSPFTEFGFLRALELSGSVGEGSGWLPSYVLVRRGGALVGAAPVYLKGHSYGEYIFDWSWASAAQRAGLSYYPKVVVAVPVTPATGKRLLLSPDLDDVSREAVVDTLVGGVMELAARAEASSVHWLFCSASERARLEARGFLGRTTFQFHWENRSYSDFDGFLDALTSRKRKQLRKERARARCTVDEVSFASGAQVGDEDLRAMGRFYRRTVDHRGGIPYLRPDFFRALCELMPHRVQFCRALQGGQICAGALYLETGDGLYGRYWGCDAQREFLHFELAYYAGIERCIERGIPRFEAGAQGEHKLLRGFLPTATHSCHWLAHPGLSRAVEGSLREEEAATAQRMAELAGYAPYKAS